MRKLDASNFIYETSIDDIYGSKKEHVRWKDEVIKILKEIFREDLGILCSNISNQLEECLDTKRRIISYNRGVDKTFNAKVKTKEELKDYFREFGEYEGQCRFQGCTHTHEPGCRVKEALDEGKISRQRYDNYLEMYTELKEKRRY